jgi:hypothetical protein
VPISRISYASLARTYCALVQHSTCIANKKKVVDIKVLPSASSTTGKAPACDTYSSHHTKLTESKFAVTLQFASQDLIWPWFSVEKKPQAQATMIPTLTITQNHGGERHRPANYRPQLKHPLNFQDVKTNSIASFCQNTIRWEPWPMFHAHRLGSFIHCRAA